MYTAYMKMYYLSTTVHNLASNIIFSQRKVIDLTSSPRRALNLTSILRSS